MAKKWADIERSHQGDVEWRFDEPHEDPKMSELYPKLNMANPHQFQQAVRNITIVHGLATPTAVRKGRHWYETVHEAVGKEIRGHKVQGKRMTGWQGAGVAAAISPTMDWEKHNIPGFQEMFELHPKAWKAVERSARQPWPRQRTPQAAEALAGTSLARVPDLNLLKAHRILHGEPVESVMPRRTAPKTYSFASNIYHPDVAGHVTIDGRAHDIAANRMTPWEYSGRGISSANLTRGTSRYEHLEHAYRQAAHALREEDLDYLPHQLQAITWEAGKEIEKAPPTLSGQPRQKGVTRIGQPYYED